MKSGTGQAVAVLAAAAFALAACTGGSTSSQSTSAGGSNASGSGKPGGTITLLIGQPENPKDLVLTKQDLAKFTQQTGVQVKLNVINNDNLRTILQTQLRSGSGPDVFGYDTGPGFAGVLAKAGLLYDLTQAYQDHKWPVYDWAKQRVTFDGKVVGIPDQVEEVGVFYNKAVFDKYGLKPPQSVADLQNIAEKLKSAGVTPFTFSDKEGWEAGHQLSIVLSSAVGESGMKDFLDGKKPWNSPEVVSAIDLFFQQFKDKGYLPKASNAITYDNANALFYQQKAAMNPTGTWLVSDIKDAAKFDVGYFPFPAPDGPGIFSGGLGGGTFVSAKTKNPQGALAYLDYILTKEHGKWQAEQHNSIPAFPIETQGLQVTPLFSQILADTRKIAGSGQSGEFGYNIDVLTSDAFNKAMWDGLQSVLAGQMTPREVADSMEAAAKKSASGA